MRHSEFWFSMEAALGAEYARSLAADLVIAALGGRTALAALEDGVEPREVWEAVCDALDLDERTRWTHRAEPRRAGHRRSRS